MPETDPAALPGPLPTKVLVYISRPAAGLTLDGVHALMTDARLNNALDGIHGLLTYDRRGFLQVLEGTAQSIDLLVARIARDSRHQAMQVLLLDTVAGQQFHSFADIVCEGQDLASPDLLHPRKLATLDASLIAAIRHGYALLDRPDEAG